jgi:hypothetical protein
MSSPFGESIVRALGLDPNELSTVTIKLEANSFPIVEAVHVLPELDDNDQLVTELRRYELVEQDGG